MIRTLIYRWQMRRLIKSMPRREIEDILEATQKAARRCAYDLGHALSLIDARDKKDWRKEFVEEMYERKHMWLAMFNPNGIKDYRNRMHKEMMDLENEIARLKRLLEKHGIEDPESIPF